MKLLMHACCAPCSIACVDALRSEGIEPVGYWNNPNIHPFTEYRARLMTLREYAASIGMEMIEDDSYGLRAFLTEVGSDFDARCFVCYRMRMDAAARKCSELGMTHFTSTLFISPYQNHELLTKAAREAADKYDVSFLYRDFRPLFRQGQARARELGLYMQKYCGCIFSEEERYLRKKKTNESR